MTEFSNDQGIAIVLLEKLTSEIIPRAKSIQERLANGEHLDHWDRQFLEDLIRDAQRIKPLVDQHPEYQALYAQVAHLYKQITDQALLNEKN
ncbi:hypothetical protein ACQE3D_24945 (plasmid) [Methylomonas sp. MS20]|uniref:hypothetical protein n=1 Tax=Methylomonas sp. MS20 TaxID=3418769 RepID=UPI003D0931E7